MPPGSSQVGAALAAAPPGTLGLAGARRLFRAISDDRSLEGGLPELEGYVLESELGSGGGGTVYLGNRRGSDFPLAVKLIRCRHSDTPSARRAWRELDLLSQLRLPCTPRVHDYGFQGEYLYIATDYVNGYDLGDYCESMQLSRRRRVTLLAQIADGVQAIHERGIIHRDIKPSNIIVDMQGNPLIVDFGVATLLLDGAADTLSADGAPVGTPAFMSPEQARGDRSEISTRSDVYGLGATACFVLTGMTPFDVDAPVHEAVRRVAQDTPRHPRDLDAGLPRDLASILAKATARSARDRYGSAGQLAADLRRWLRGEPIAWTRPSLASRCRYWIRANPWLAASTSVAVLAMTAAVFAGSIAWANASIADEEARLAADRGAHLEAMQAWRTEVLAREEKVKERRRKQIERVKLAIDRGELFNASIVLLDFAEEVQAEGLEDEQALGRFIELLNDLVAAAREGRDVARQE